jgi:hypothetical protein
VHIDAEGDAAIEVLPDIEGEDGEAQEFDVGDLQGGKLIKDWNSMTPLTMPSVTSPNILPLG